MARFPAEVLFKAFQRAGMLVTAVYRPGLPAEQRFSAQWTRPDQLLLGGDAQAPERQLEYQRADAPPLIDGDRIDLIEPGSCVVSERLRVRGDPMAQGDGTYARVFLDPA